MGIVINGCLGIRVVAKIRSGASAPIVYPAPSTSFNPTTLFSGGVQGVWYDPSDLSTLFQDTAGTIPVTGANQLVALIKDKSGNNNHAIQPTDNIRPKLLQDANGYYLNFDGSLNFFYTATPLDLSAKDELTACVGFGKLASASAAVNGVILEHSAISDNFNGTFFMLNQRSSGAAYGVRSKGTVAQEAQIIDYAAAAVQVVTMAAKIGTDTDLLRVNKLQVASVTADQGAGNFTSQTLYIGKRGGTQLALKGRVYQIILVNTLYTGQTLTDLEDFINTKIGAY